MKITKTHMLIALLGAIFLGLLIFMNASFGIFERNWLASDYMLMHISSKALLNGFDLYDPVQWEEAHVLFGETYRDNPIFLYPLPFSLFGIPYSIFSIPIAGNLWLLSTEFTIIAIAAYYIQRIPNRTTPKVVFLAFAVGLFHPWITTFFVAQHTFIFLLALFGALIFVRREQDFPAGAMLAILALRPNAVIYLLLGCLIWAAWQRRWRIWLGSGVAGGLMLTFSWIISPGWFIIWVNMTIGEAGKIHTFINYVPTLWGFFNDFNLFPISGLRSVVGTGITIFALILSAYILMRYNYREFEIWVAVFMPASLFLSPYAWNYDQLLLLPVFLILLSHIPTLKLSIQKAYWNFISITMLGLPYIIRYFSNLRGRDSISFIFPMTVWVLALLIIYNQKSPNLEATRTH